MLSEGKRANLLRQYFSPIFKFFKDYVIQLGILDGKTGMAICSLSAYAVFLKYKKLRKIYYQKYH